MGHLMAHATTVFNLIIMERKIYKEIFSGYGLRYAFQYPGAEVYMLPYIKRTEEIDYDILAAPEYIDAHRPFYTESTDDRYVEYKSLIKLTSLALLPNQCCIIHAVAVRMNGFCWLISAPPGTGKTTQYYNLKNLYGEKAEMVCGDMPLLKTSGNGSIMVHPSPWNGKERIKGKISAPLGGILLLRQGDQNSIRRMDPSEAVFPVLTQLAVQPDTEDQVLQIAKFAEDLLQHFPVWEMVNKGDLESSRLAAETFRSYIKDQNNDV